MHVYTRVRPYRSALAGVVALLLIGTACSGGIRPTLTGDRLDESSLVGEEEQDLEASAGQNDATQDSLTDDPAPAEVVEQTPTPVAPESSSPTPDPAVVEQLFVEVIETLPHDPSSFTQGLELHDGFFIESTGSRGPGNTLRDSTLRRVDPATGVVEQSITIQQPYFAEGVTKVGDQLVQLTWQDNVAFYWDAASFELVKTVSYGGEGWGLCYDGSQLIMTDGTPTLIFRDPITFDELSRIPVTLNGSVVDDLNEIECVNGSVWANVWLTDQIVRIDPATGNVTAIVDATALDRPVDDGNAVLNGIAWDAATDTFYLTGKLWPTMYRVNFVENPAG